MIDPPDGFLSSANGVLVYELKCRDCFPSADFMHSVRVLHCMKGASGFAKLVGVVTDDEGIYLKGYLIEFPRARWNLIQLAGNPSVSWERRKKWAIQLIEGVSKVHKEALTVGGLTISIFSLPLVIDRTDSVCFWSFKERIETGRIHGSYYPPGFRHLREMSPMMKEAERPHATSTTDIFHLGLLLWLLAENKPFTSASPVCMRESFDTRRTSPCDLSHLEPVALPQLSDIIPQYFRDIVSDCRADNPIDRPATWELLQRIPPVSMLQPVSNIQGSCMPDLDHGLRTLNVSCDICGTRHLQVPRFRCNICDDGDFDLCQSCHEKGAHCHDEMHLLIELGRIGNQIVPLRYHSNMKVSGERDIITL